MGAASAPLVTRRGWQGSPRAGPAAPTCPECGDQQWERWAVCGEALGVHTQIQSHFPPKGRRMGDGTTLAAAAPGAHLHRLKHKPRSPRSSCVALAALTQQCFNPCSASLCSPISLSGKAQENRKAVRQRWLCRRLLTRAGEEARPPWPRHSLTQRGRSSSCHFQPRPAWEQIPPREIYVQFLLRGGSAVGWEPAAVPGAQREKGRNLEVFSRCS